MATHVAIVNDIAQMPRLHEAVESFGQEHGLSQAAIFEFGLALDELVTNIISYGYSGNGGHLIQVTLDMAGGDLLAVISDDGQPFDPTRAQQPDTGCNLESRCVGGLGIHLARNLVNSIDYARDGARNIVTLRKSPVARCESKCATTRKE